MSDENTTLYAGIVIALIIGAAVGYFVYPSMNNSPQEQPIQPSPQDGGGHNHLGLWIALLIVAVFSILDPKKDFVVR